jgi:AAHS family 4-hydroxybenzoate transporter-like MFS transporter
MNLLSVYFLGNWLTTLTHSAGFPLQVATILPAIQSVGAIIGTLVIGVVITRFNGYVVLCCYYIGAAIALVFIGYFGAVATPIMIAAFFAGWFVIGSQYGANAMAAAYYPTFIRSSGVGWALGVGRAGNIVGPVIGGVMLGTGWSIAIIWFVSACAPVIAALAVLGVRSAAATARPQESAVAAE